MSFTILGKPFVARAEQKGGFHERRLFVEVQHDDGSKTRMLAADAKRQKDEAKKKADPPSTEVPE